MIFFLDYVCTSCDNPSSGAHFCGSCNKPCNAIDTCSVQTGNEEGYGRVVICTKCVKANPNTGRCAAPFVEQLHS